MKLVAGGGGNRGAAHVKLVAQTYILPITFTYSWQTVSAENGDNRIASKDAGSLLDKGG